MTLGYEIVDDMSEVGDDLGDRPPPIGIDIHTLLTQKLQVVPEKMTLSDDTLQEKLILENNSKAIHIEVGVAIIVLKADFVG